MFQAPGYLFLAASLKPSVMALKENTRLKKDPSRALHIGTAVEELLEKAYSEALRRAGLSAKQHLPWRGRLRNPCEDVYTVVSALWIGLVDIFHSMSTNSEGGDIEVETSITQQRCFQIRISDPQSKGLDVRAGRDFAHGKLDRAVNQLFAITGYWIFAFFEGGAAYRVDMLTGKTARVKDARYPGFTHLIVLPNEKGFIEEPSVGETTTESDSAPAPRRTVRVLVIDFTEQRRNDNIQRWQALPDVEIDGVAHIDRESYTSCELDLVLVHESNPESKWIKQDPEERWPIVFFSGDNHYPCEIVDGRWFVTPAFLREHFGKLVDKIVREGSKDCVGLS